MPDLPLPFTPAIVAATVASCLSQHLAQKPSKLHIQSTYTWQKRSAIIIINNLIKP
jgi:hypothetical protein